MVAEKSGALSPKEEAEKEDRKLLSEENKHIQEIMQLLSDGDTHATARQKVNDAKNKMRLKNHAHSVFHPYKDKRIAMTQEASRNLVLGDALELMLTTSQYHADLNKALIKSSQRRVDILTRLISRT